MRSKIIILVMAFFIIQYSEAAQTKLTLKFLKLFTVLEDFSCKVDEGNKKMVSSLLAGEEGDVIAQSSDGTDGASESHHVYTLGDIADDTSDEETSDEETPDDKTSKNPETVYRFITGTKPEKEGIETAGLFKIEGGKKVYQVKIDIAQLNVIFSDVTEISHTKFIKHLGELGETFVDLTEFSDSKDEASPTLPPKNKSDKSGKTE